MIYPDWYERLSQLEYNYNPEQNGEPWYRADDVWACIEPPKNNQAETVGDWFRAMSDEELAKHITKLFAESLQASTEGAVVLSDDYEANLVELLKRGKDGDRR